MCTIYVAPCIFFMSAWKKHILSCLWNPFKSTANDNQPKRRLPELLRLQVCLTDLQVEQEPAVTTGKQDYPAWPGLCLSGGSRSGMWEMAVEVQKHQLTLTRCKWARTPFGKASRQWGNAPLGTGVHQNDLQFYSEGIIFCKGFVSNKGSRGLGSLPHITGDTPTPESRNILTFLFYN